MEHRESEAAVKRAAGRRRSSSAPTLWGEDASPRGPRGGRSARPAETGRGQKRPFDIDEAVRLLREAIKPFPAAAMFALKEEGYGTLFQQLVACIISIRTRDETSLPVSLRLLKAAPTAGAMAKLSADEIDALIRPATFHEPKARTIRAIAHAAVIHHGGELPCDRETLLAFPGVGPKCASLALGIACGQPHISVDVHVDRVVNRWGYVAAKTPEKTMLALMETLPEKYWIELNRLLVPFGKHVCTAERPKCSGCPLLSMCRQVGVADPR
jgi:endonuclease-3